MRTFFTLLQVILLIEALMVHRGVLTFNELKWKKNALEGVFHVTGMSRLRSFCGVANETLMGPGDPQVACHFGPHGDGAVEGLGVSGS